MASILRASALFLTVAAPALAQFVKAPTDLTTTKGNLDLPVRWKEVPEGTCELTPGVKSYSGYVDIEDNQHIFFWFFEARDQKPEDAELTVWINGGPGSSSMIGLFEELGPCRIDIDGNLVNNPYAWNNVSNMLFIDHPAQVGFSYSTPIPSYISSEGSVVQLPDATCPEYAADLDCATRSQPKPTDTANSTSSAAPSMWKTIQGFMGAFPQYSRTEFNFATESYGGHYGPIFNAYIESQNKLIDHGSLPGAKHINLRTVLIGNGWYDPLIHYQAYYNFTVFPGNTYDYRPYNKSVEDQIYNALYGTGNCYDQTVACNTGGLNEVCMAADNFCANEIEIPLDNEGRDEYDIRELTPDPFPYSFYSKYLNSEKVQQAIGAYVNWTSSNSAVGNAFGSTGDDDREDGTIEATRSLVEQGIYVVQFAGDADYNCNWLGGEVVAEHVDAPGFGTAGYTNITTSDDIVHGQVKQSANFAFARIYESGHEVPFYQPVIALEMFNRSIHGLDIAKGEEKISLGCAYKSVGTAKSEYREGNGTVQFKVLPVDATYNTTLNGPNPINGTDSSESAGKEGEAAKRGMMAKQSLKSRRTFKPSFGRKMK